MLQILVGNTGQLTDKLCSPPESTMILGGINPTHNDCFQPQLFPPTFAVFFPPLCHKKETLIKFIKHGRLGNLLLKNMEVLVHNDSWENHRTNRGINSSERLQLCP